MPRPVTTPYQEELYAALGVANTYADEALGWPLLNYCGAVASMFDQIEAIARDLDDGTPGWAIIMNPDLAAQYAPEFLPWLGQFVGVQVDTTLSIADQVTQIKVKDGFRRGTSDAFAEAAKLYLTGTKYVLLKERYGGDAYKIFVRTLISETPNEAQVLAAMLAQKPAGIVLDYDSVAGPTYDIEAAAIATYNAAAVRYATYNDAATQMP